MLMPNVGKDMTKESLSYIFDGGAKQQKQFDKKSDDTLQR